ncbi:MAG: alpha-glucosidase/alpha-galactosidase [Clostridia bacterium]|nr:alpha-glucosidase/alpha-galactosidase [Clostridia bacterium]NLS84594.1 alpha-glucosidase/alpha-galactosidase [Oscillospiraceae bacterium]
MKYTENKVEDVHIAYIGGGSRGWAWQFMSDLANDTVMSGEVRLYDIDMEAAKHNEIIGNKYTTHKDHKGDWLYRAVPSLQEALTGADFVIISILPATFKEMGSDIHAPEKYSIYQSVGDTAGPGGLMRAMRTIPMYVEIANAIKAFCPDSWVINYTNPMTVCVRTLYTVFPQIKAFGCCHEVFGTQKLLAYMLDDMLGIKDVQRSEIKVNVLGINHFTWFDKASYKGMDLFPIYKQFVDKHYDEGVCIYQDSNWLNSTFKSQERVKFDLFRRYGLIAAAGDRHLVEFLPPWYLKNPETVKSWMFGLTTIDMRLKQLDERLERSKRLVSGEEEVSMKPSGEEGVLLMKALLGMGDIISNVNIPNYGQIPNLPLGAVVETNALFRCDDIAPVMAGKLPDDLCSLVIKHCLQQENTVKAGLTCDKELAFRAFMDDPLMTIGLNDGKELFETMLHNQKDYLPGWNVK